MWQVLVSSVLLCLATVSAKSLMKERKNKIKEKKETPIEQDITDDEGSSIVPVFPGYHFQYGPEFLPDYRMLPHFDDEENTADPEARSFGVSKTKPNKDKVNYRREVLLWPRPCGWEWDGNMYRWGPCNTFFGGPGFPW